MSAMEARPEIQDGGTRSTARAMSATVVRGASRYGIIVLLVLLVLSGTLTQDRFLTSANLIGIVSQNAPLGLVAIGMTFVLITGGFDLSVGATVSAGAIVFARLATETNIGFAFCVAMIVGLACGLTNAFVITVLKVNPFVATFGTASVFSGATLLYTHGKSFVAGGSAFAYLGAGDLGPLPVSVWVLALTFIVAGFVLAKMKYGRMVYAVGGNEEASRLSGINVSLIRGSAYVVLGILAALAGAMLASRLAVGQSNLAPQIALDSIAVVVIGGTSLMGGEGAMWRTVVGLIILGVLTNLFFGWSVDPNWQLIAKGAIVIGAVSLDYFGRRLR